ncbi:MAG: hypothetical protein ACT4N5_06395 [Nitrosopumilaceae archaeon]
MTVKLFVFLFLISILIPSSFAADKETQEPNISGSVTMPDKFSQDPIRVFSTAKGLVTEIKNNDLLVLENKDMGVKISGVIKDGQRGDKIKIIILRPDDSVFTTGAYLSDVKEYSIPVKLHTKWVEGVYKILVGFIDKEESRIRFFVTDRDLLVEQKEELAESDIVSKIFDYLDGIETKEGLTSYLKEVGWSKYRIDNFFIKNIPKPGMDISINYTSNDIDDTDDTPDYDNPFVIYFLVALLPVAYFIVRILAKKKSRINPQAGKS